MNAKSILKKVQTELASITYIKAVYIGPRLKEMKIATPSITLSPDMNPSEEKKDSRENKFTLTIYAVNSVRDVESLIIGKDTAIKGIMDIEEDIKAKLYAKFPRLDGECNSFLLSTQQYIDNAFPVGTVIIEAEFRFTEG